MKSNFDTMQKKVFSANYAFKNLSRYLHNHKRLEKNKKYYFYDHGSLLSVNIPVSTEITDVIQVGGSKNIVEDSRLNTKLPKENWPQAF